MLWLAIADLVVPGGTVRRAFAREALPSRRRDQRIARRVMRGVQREVDRFEELYSRTELGVVPFKPRPGVNTERLRLRRHDGQIFLDRWGVEHDRIGGIFLHKMSAPDPGIDLHDHPWWFASLVLQGGYIEERAASRESPRHAQLADAPHESTIELEPGNVVPFTDELRETLGFGDDPPRPRGVVYARRRGSVRTMRLDESHRITQLTSSICWTLVMHGPRRRRWGFFLPSGWVDEHTYDETVRVDRRDLWNEAV